MRTRSEAQRGGGAEVADWYIATGQGAAWVGPMTESEVCAKLASGEISWNQLCWRAGSPAWTPIRETQPFQSGFPSSSMMSGESPVIRRSSRHASPPTTAPLEADWFLYLRGAQQGPYTEQEIHRALRSGSIDGRAHVWTQGFAGWERLERVERFASSLPSGAASRPASPPPAPTDEMIASPSSGEHRRSARRALAARALVATGEGVTVALCRDISLGGMRVVSDQVPGPVGTRVKMNICPSSREAGRRFDPFVAEGVIVRVIDGPDAPGGQDSSEAEASKRGFSFRFERLPAEARQAIQDYVQAG